ncbi:GTPase [Halocalculus aciditolerans]|uniref:GTPase n=1 Tax=Halocalculus aciditolerans TaxID=1383812 RepID=A0A830FFX0_9EURY|nr:GTPase [Halocalculus aciditolerans]GGL50992.1 GTPase [Halocalculus aciditolerans]
MRRVVIAGAAGRDFHDYHQHYRDDPDARVVAFTRAAGQNLGEADADLDAFPGELTATGDPIPIVPEADLERVVGEANVDEVAFAYSDVSHEHVMHVASRALAAGADFHVVGPDDVSLPCEIPVFAADAVRTGCGKSALAKAAADHLQEEGFDVAVVREPMPYGDLAERRVDRYDSRADLEGLTLEEREEYRPHVDAGHTVFAGVDYAAVRDAVEAEFDVAVWDGGNNELPFLDPDAHVVLADALRPTATDTFHPGETNLRLADAVLVTKENSASDDAVADVVDRVRGVNSAVPIYHADSVVTVGDTVDGEPAADALENARVLAVEDGPTLTHGDADYGAATVAADRYDADRIDPRPHAVGSLADVLDEYPRLDCVLPAMGYSERQRADLADTIEHADPDVVLAGTPVALDEVLDVDVPVVDVDTELDIHDTAVETLVERYLGPSLSKQA